MSTRRTLPPAERLDTRTMRQAGSGSLSSRPPYPLDGGHSSPPTQRARGRLIWPCH
jgi:hypothetical protein